MAMTNLAWDMRSSNPYFEQEPTPSSPPREDRHPWPTVASAPRRLEPVRRSQSDLAETLSLPPGLHGQALPPGVAPRTIGEARVLHTQLSRSLGRFYRERWGVLLRADRSGIELMQRILPSRFPWQAIETFDEARDVIAHGAFLSEIFARAFGAVWTDMAPRELSDWRMAAPHCHDLCPFGRVVAFVRREPGADLVTCFDELSAGALID
jgi:hypothetical protein